MVRRAALIAVLALLATAASVAAEPTGTPTQVATDLETPWEMVETSEGRVLVTELPGEVRVINGTTLSDTPLYEDRATVRKFLGLALAPDYPVSKHVFLYRTLEIGESQVIRLTDTGDALTSPTVIFGGIDSDFAHDGGRIAFGPDGYLYVTTGDIHDHDRPRNIDNLNGKILRITATGEPAPGNPFHSDGVRSGRDYVWSYGHRHPQGLAWDAAGRLWETEHGPSGEGPDGAVSGRDELNLIEAGKDYGWPEVAGEQYCTNVATVAPIVHSGPAPAWAPADLDHVATDGYLYAPALNGRHLHVFDTGGGATVGRHAFKTFSTVERLRSATLISPSEMWVATHSSPSHRIFSTAIAAGSAGLTWVANASVQNEPVTCAARTEDSITPPPGDTLTPTATTTPPATSVPPVLGGPVVQPQAVSSEARASALARRLRSALRPLRVRELLRRGSVVVSAGGFDAGSRVHARLVLRRSGRAPLTVGTGRVRPASRGAVTVRVRLGRRGRAALRRATTARLTFRVSYVPPGAAAVTRSATATIRR